MAKDLLACEFQRTKSGSECPTVVVVVLHWKDDERHSRFADLRDDKRPRELVREVYADAR